MTNPPVDPRPGMPSDLPERDPVALASRWVDGDLTADLLARASEDHQVSAIADRFEALREHLLQPVGADVGRQEHHLAIALAAFAEPIAAEPAISTVRSLDAARHRRTRRLAPVLAAAAAVAVLGIVIGSVANSRSSRDTIAGDAAAPVEEPVSKAETAEANASAATARESVPESASGSQSMAAAAAVEEPGTAATDASAQDTPTSDGNGGGDPTYVANAPEQLVALAQSLVPATQSGGYPLLVNACDTRIDGVALARLLWDQRPALLYVTPDTSLPKQVVVVDPDTCATLITAALGG